MEPTEEIDSSFDRAGLSIMEQNRKVTLLVSDFADVELPPLPDVPGMTSVAECRYLFWLASSQLVAVGDLVEVGSWLGRSALHLAADIKHSGLPAKLHCFDGFTWAPSDSNNSDLPLKPGDSFLPYFQQNVASYRDLVSSHRNRIADITWPGDPIEVLLLDAPKKLKEITRCLEVFGPSLVPGKSIIAIQDYQYFPAYALAACMYALRDSLELRHVVLEGSTVAFQVTRPIDLQQERPVLWELFSWSPSQIHAAWDSILESLPPQARDRIEPGRALHLYDSGAKGEAKRVMKALPMTTFQNDKIARLSKSHHYLGYPELFSAAGCPGTVKQIIMSRAKRARD